MRMTTVAASTVLLLPLLLLGGCSSTPSEPTLYLLRGQPAEGSGEVAASLRFGLGRVILAPYLLSSTGLVVETAPGEVRSARLHRWAEPLDAGMRWFVRTEIARSLGHEVGGGLSDVMDWDYTIDLYVGRLHGSMSGDAMIEAAWVLRVAHDDTALREYRFGKRVPLPQAGYAGLVAAEEDLLRQLSAQIAESLRPYAEQAMSAAEDPDGAAEPAGAP